jgi:hypothetical protein
VINQPSLFKCGNNSSRCVCTSNSTSVLRPIRAIACGHSVWEMPEGVALFLSANRIQGNLPGWNSIKTHHEAMSVSCSDIVHADRIACLIRGSSASVAIRPFSKLLYYCRTYFLTQSQKSVCPQKPQHVIPVLFKLRPAGPIRPARDLKSGPWRYVFKSFVINIYQGSCRPVRSSFS